MGPSFLRTPGAPEVSTARGGHPIRDSDPLVSHWSASCPPGADINTQASDGASALYEACKNEHQLVVEFLLSQGADANKANKDGMLPLHIASKKGNYRSARPGHLPRPHPLHPAPGGLRVSHPQDEEGSVTEEGTFGGKAEGSWPARRNAHSDSNASRKANPGSDHRFPL